MHQIRRRLAQRFADSSFNALLTQLNETHREESAPALSDADQEPEESSQCVFVALLHFLSIAEFLLKTGGEVRDEVHTLVTDVDETKEPVKFAPVKRGHTSLARNTASDELSAC